MTAVEIVLSNRSGKMLCVSADDLSADGGNTVIFRPGNEPKGELRGDGPIEEELGFFFADSYFFVRPGKDKKVPLYPVAMGLKKGRYEYSILATYYACEDVSNQERIRSRRPVASYLLSARGELVFADDPR